MAVRGHAETQAPHPVHGVVLSTILPSVDGASAPCGQVLAHTLHPSPAAHAASRTDGMASYPMGGKVKRPRRLTSGPQRRIGFALSGRLP